MKDNIVGGLNHESEECQLDGVYLSFFSWHSWSDSSMVSSVKIFPNRLVYEDKGKNAKLKKQPKDSQFVMPNCDNSWSLVLKNKPQES